MKLYRRRRWSRVGFLFLDSFFYDPSSFPFRQVITGGKQKRAEMSEGMCMDGKVQGRGRDAEEGGEKGGGEGKKVKKASSN